MINFKCYFKNTFEIYFETKYSGVVLRKQCLLAKRTVRRINCSVVYADKPDDLEG